MKRKLYQIAKKYGAAVLSYKSFRSVGAGGLQVFDIKLKKGKRVLNFTDSYFHLSGDAPKVIIQFEEEIKQRFSIS